MTSAQLSVDAMGKFQVPPYDEPDTPPVSPNLICEHCRKLEIDDEALGGEARSSLEDGDFLVLGEDDRPQMIWTKYKVEDVYPGFPVLEAAARAGCRSCRYLRTTLVEAGLRRPEGASGKVILSATYLWKLQPSTLFTGGSNVFSDRGLAALGIQVKFMLEKSLGNTGEPVQCPVISFNIDSDCNVCSSWLRLDSSPSPKILDPVNVEWIQGLKKRQEGISHVEGDPAEGNFLPTRLIDLGDKLSKQPIRLVHSADIDGKNQVDLQYAALSYCWGPPADAAFQFQTTPETLPERLRHIDLDSTTEVMKDAATTCQALGIRYLWIDAVCIIQGDRRDWEREASQMGLVYQNAAITLAIMSSATCLEGFLGRPRANGLKMSFVSKVKPGLSGYYYLRFSSVNLKWDLFTAGDPAAEDETESAWQHRAWTFQEYQLSPFTIMFGRRRIHIATGEGVISEGHSIFQKIGIPAVPLLSDYEAYSEDENYYNHWMRLAADFCQRQLTNPTDKFPALSGLAAFFSEVLDDRYVAGLWERDLHRELYWTAPSRPFKSPRELIASLVNANPYIAPSWSWAVQDRIFEPSHRYFHMTGAYVDYKPEYTAMEPLITLSGSKVDPMGQIRDARLRVTSRLRTVCEGIGLVRDEVFTDKPLHQIKSGTNDYLADCWLDWEQGGVVEAEDYDLKLLLLGSCTTDNEDAPFGRGSRFVWGLIIHPELVESVGSANYYRVGVFYSKPKGRGGEALFQECSEEVLYLI